MHDQQKPGRLNWLTELAVKSGSWSRTHTHARTHARAHTHTRLVNRDLSTKGLKFFSRGYTKCPIKRLQSSVDLFSLFQRPCRYSENTSTLAMSSAAYGCPTQPHSGFKTHDDAVCRQLIQSTVMLNASFALSTYVVNTSSQPWCYTLRSHCQRMSSTRPVNRDVIRFVRIVNVCRQHVQSTVMLHVSFASSTSVVNSSSLKWCYTVRSYCQRMSSTNPVYRDAIRFVCIVNVCRQLVQSTVMLYVSFALSTYVVNSSSLPWYDTFRSYRQRMSSTRPVYRDAVRFVRIVNVCRQLVQSTVMLYVSSASSTYVVNLSSLPWCNTLRPHCQRLSSTRRRSIECTAYNKSSSSWLMHIY